MPSLLVTVIVAAFVALPALGLYVPRVDDTIEYQQCRNRSDMETFYLGLCMVRAIGSGGNPEELYPDSPSPRLSVVCSKRDELHECFRRLSNNLTDTNSSPRELELVRFQEQSLQSVVSFYCRPDIMQLIGRDYERNAYLLRKVESCGSTKGIGTPVSLCDVRDPSYPGVEGKTCRYLVKVVQCARTQVKTEKPELEELATAMINSIKDSDACRVYFQEIVDSESTEEDDSIFLDQFPL
ncbi:uncharacterized protein LOC124154348 isoform X2 [Ischnura elegans]|uniref:uncharacterized protein LOC124154348 isoform X2 n=1 Tax=Ischnura elegans TaxID=197161 RepID=UPI001ED87AAE|nr:uncharacterized protein LOC124154348 isoform X2 [Ischnura elegans]